MRNGNVSVEQVAWLLDDLDEVGLELSVVIDDPTGLPSAGLLALWLDLRRAIDALTRHAEALDQAHQEHLREARRRPRELYQRQARRHR